MIFVTLIAMTFHITVHIIIHVWVTRVFKYDFQTFLSLASSLLAFHSSKSLTTSPHVF